METNCCIPQGYRLASVVSLAILDIKHIKVICDRTTELHQVVNTKNIRIANSPRDNFMQVIY